MEINHIPTKFHCPVTGELIFSEHSNDIVPSKATLFMEYPNTRVEIFDERLKMRVKESPASAFVKVEELIGKQPQLFTFYQKRENIDGEEQLISLKICIDMAYKNDEFELINS
ncbi:hypothetical protein [Flammeovirga sp. SJP92]|uniref:hypothetical protein n=1 Tax=Flammeovirga sp. SJP92 TaxID=1775430 RepID=UPI0007877502|nr:hypothetical protein [Flammeovirga sp. SJP92]KXX66848.1 hypothetical protein AVL50_30415 [Flammeovirga sp. SJP92]